MGANCCSQTHTLDALTKPGEEAIKETSHIEKGAQEAFKSSTDSEVKMAQILLASDPIPQIKPSPADIHTQLSDIGKTPRTVSNDKTKSREEDKNASPSTPIFSDANPLVRITTQDESFQDIKDILGLTSITVYDEMKEEVTFPPPADFNVSISPGIKLTYNKQGPFKFRLKEYPGTDNPVELVRHESEIFYGQVRQRSSGETVREGKGYLSNKDLQIYIGYFFKDTFHGPGVMVYRDGSYFRGIWSNSQLQGFGIYVAPDGKTYRGNWSKNLQEGYGEETWDNGKSYYKGNFRRGQREGEGVLHLADENVTYKGRFKANQFDGKGEYKWADRKTYTGEWKDDLMHGYGVFKWPDGRSYEGDYRFGKKEGFGTFSWEDGRRYEGSWKRGLQNGNGVYFEDGIKTLGFWVDGIRQVMKAPSNFQIKGVAIR